MVDAAGGPTTWVQTPGDPRNTYLPRIEWAADGRALAVQQMNRLQNRNDVLIADPRTGAVKRTHRDESKAWVEVADEFTWLDQGRAFLWMSEKDGWRHLYRVATDGSGERLVTAFEGDVIAMSAVDAKAGWVYFPRRRRRGAYSSRRLTGGWPERVRPHRCAASPHNCLPTSLGVSHLSRMDVSPVTDPVSLPDHPGRGAR